MNNGTMLYRSPGPEVFEGIPCETTIVEAEDVEGKLAEGWHRCWPEAGAAAQETAAKLAANEAEQARIAAELAKGSQNAGGLKAVHKGAGKYEVQDAEGKVVQSGLTKDDANALVTAGGLT